MSTTTGPQSRDLSGRPFVLSPSCLSPGRWVAGPWSPCSATCEKGIQHREVTCVYQLQNGTHVATRPLYCPVPRPSPVQSCEGQDCLSIWEASEWSQVGARAALRAETTTRAPGPCLQGPQNGPLSSVLFVTHPQEYPHQTREQLKAAFWVTYSQIPSDVSTWPQNHGKCIFYNIYHSTVCLLGEFSCKYRWRDG